jgi:hypothetical protein
MGFIVANPRCPLEALIQIAVGNLLFDKRAQEGFLDVVFI